MNAQEFNSEIVNNVNPAMCIATMGSQQASSTRCISVPFMTNVNDVVQGKELICELKPRSKSKKVAKQEIGKM